MSKLKRLKSFLEEKLDFFKKVEDVEDKRPPKAWWDDCYATIKKKNPDYTDEEIRGTCGKIWHKTGVREKIGDLVVNDFITTDFQIINDSMLGGYVVRDGQMPYGDQVKIKEWDNLKKAYGNLDKVIAYGSKYNDSHYESDNRMIGYWDDFKFIERGMPGVYAKEGVASHDPKYNEKMDIDNKHNRVWAKLNTNKDIDKLSDLEPEELNQLPVSASYDDLGVGNIQKVGKIHHIAVSLNKNEQDRCSQMGTACNISLMDMNHDQIEGVLTHDFDDSNGVLRADSHDQSQPPTNKNKKEKAMGKKKNKNAEEDKEEEYDEEMEKKDKTEDDVADGENKIMTGGEKKYPKGVVEGDDPEVEEKIKGSPYGSPQSQKIGEKSKDLIEIDTVKDMITEAVQFAMKPYKDAEEAKQASDFREILIKEPYGYPEDYLKDKSLTKLKEIKEDFEQSKAFKDHIEQAQDFGISDINKSLFNEGTQPKNIMADFINSSQKEHWGWTDPETRKDFFKEGV